MNNNTDISNLKEQVKNIYEQIVALQVPSAEKNLMEKTAELLQNTNLIIKQNEQLINLVETVLQRLDFGNNNMLNSQTTQENQTVVETEIIKQEETQQKQEEIITQATEVELPVSECMEKEQSEIPNFDVQQKNIEEENNLEKEEKSQVINRTEKETAKKKETSSVLEFLHTRVIKDTENSEENKPQTNTQETASQRLNNLLKQQENFSVTREQTPETNKETFNQRPTSIGDKFEAANKTNLNFTIGISNKFMLINDLFAGNVQTYESFIDELGKADSLKTSMQIINNARLKHKWAISSSAYATLTDMIQKRFE